MGKWVIQVTESDPVTTLLCIHSYSKYNNDAIYSCTYRNYVWDKCVKNHLDPLWKEKSTASYHVNVSDTKYLLLRFEDNSIALVDAAAPADDR